MNHDNLAAIICFLSVVAAIVALALIGGTGSDLAIMTGLIGVLGTFRPSKATADVRSAENVNVGNPVNVGDQQS